jgi:hypothetical protein
MHPAQDSIRARIDNHEKGRPMRMTYPLIALLATVAAGCGMMGAREVEGPPRKETILALTESNKLLRFNAGQPQKAVAVGTVSGLQPNERLLGIDFRVAKGVLYALGSSGRIYTLDTKTAQAKQVGVEPLAFSFSGDEFGFDFNPAVDRIRIVTDSGQNMRAHPDTGAGVDGNPTEPGLQRDGTLAWAPTEPDRDNRKPRIVAAAYTYNKQNEKITTNYAIDAQSGSLVMQGSKEGATPAVSPNTGQLFRVGSLGVSSFSEASFDIADVTGAAFVSINYGRAGKLYVLNLDTGSASLIGTIGGGEKIRGISVEP